MGYDDLVSMTTRSSGFCTILRRFVAWITVRVYVLTERQKKCIEDAIAEDIIAITHDDDLHFIEDVVGPSQNPGIYTQTHTDNARP